MHRIAAIPGGWTSDTDGVILIEQSSSPVVFLCAADTDIQTLAVTISHLPRDFPAIRAMNLLQLQQPLSIDHYADTVLSYAKIIIIRLLGGRSYWSYGLEVVKEIVAETGASLWVLPGENSPDPTLMSHSTVSLSQVNQLWRYLSEGGIENFVNGLMFVSDCCLKTHYRPCAPQSLPLVGLLPNFASKSYQSFPSVGILFYRSHYLSGNLAPITALCQELSNQNLHPFPLFVSSLRDLEVQEAVLEYFKHQVDIIINTTSFSLAKLDLATSDENNCPLWQNLNIPVLQAIFSSSTIENWENHLQGLTPRDVAMNVALPEVDGRIITRAISFKSVKTWNTELETDIVVYQPQRDRLQFVVDLAKNWVNLRRKSNRDKKIAIILANYPNKNGRLANGVGLDTPASCIEILRALAKADYTFDPSRFDIPQTPEDLIHGLTSGITNDPEGKDYRKVYQFLPSQSYKDYFSSLPQETKDAVIARWGNRYLSSADTSIPIAGIQLGNIFIGIQPSRGYDLDPSLNYHAPDLEPTPDYLAYYCWSKNVFQADAIIHLGKHGNLEWLPGKSVALSRFCYPEIALGTIPHFYPFIVNDPGEGSQAKRRAHGVILDHLTPPLTQGGLYGDLATLETLIDEYTDAQILDPSRLSLIGDRITTLLTHSHLTQDLNIEQITPDTLPEILNRTDTYLCDLKAAQIRDGLHIFGICPQGELLIDLILSIARSGSLNRLGITQAIAQDLHLLFDPLTANPTDKFDFCQEMDVYKDIFLFVSNLQTKTSLNTADVIEAMENEAKSLIKKIVNQEKYYLPNLKKTQSVLNWIENTLLRSLYQTSQEITHLIKGLDGQYIPSGASGAPTRGRPDVLPTGRNFYSVDIRAIPTETAWDMGRKAAETLIERYTQENGEYPKTLAISIWGTSTMRTGGDDVAQVLALLGVQPIWDGASRRVVDTEILTPSALKRPRVDVTVRVSGFFRDAFPNLLYLLNNSIKAVACLEEEPEINPLAAQVKTETGFWENQGLAETQAKAKATARIFGSKPGAYGAGLQGLIEAQNWKDEEDLARAYLNWSCYAYDHNGVGQGMSEVFEQRLKNLQIVLHNQDNREHDLLDSDDYYQFQGGLTVAVKALTGKNPTVYFGDNSMIGNPKVRLLKEEIARVYRSRVVNPKWIKGVMRHGYKGAFELAATVDYLFAYDATTKCVEDYMYQGVAEAYLLDENVAQFIEQKNPWVLRDMAERLLEAHQRGLWKNVELKLLDQLRTLVHQGEEKIENLS